jgi:Xaa-Pro aminopeptidase
MNNFEKIRQMLDKKGLDAVLVTSEANRKYATGFHSTAGMALITKNQTYFYIDSRYIEAARKSIEGAVIEMTDLSISYYDKVNAVIKNEGIKILGVEDGGMSHSDYIQTQNKLKIELASAQALFTELRMVKNAEEIEKLTRAQRIAEKAYEQVLGIIRPGLTEKDIASELIYRMLKAGAEGLSFDPIVVSGAKSSLPHGVPGDKAIQRGDFLTMDFGCRYDGYCSDMTRTVAVGGATDEMRLVYETVLKAQKTAISNAKAGITGAEVDKFARDIITEAGYGQYFGHGFGHGVGLDVHEAPTANPSGNTAMPIGSVISAEPGIYLPQRFGVRIEDVIVLTGEGNTDITLAPKELLII